MYFYCIITSVLCCMLHDLMGMLCTGDPNFTVDGSNLDSEYNSTLEEVLMERHLEVGWVYPQLVGVQSLQRTQGDSQMADISGSLCYGQDDLLPVGEQVRGAFTDVEMGKVCLGTRECDEHPAGMGKTRDDGAGLLYLITNIMTVRVGNTWRLKLATPFAVVIIIMITTTRTDN